MTYPWFSLNSFNNFKVSQCSDTTKGSFIIVLISNSSLLNITERMSFACTTPIKSSNSPFAIKNRSFTFNDFYFVDVLTIFKINPNNLITWSHYAFNFFHRQV